MRIPSVHPSTVFHEGNTLLNHPDKKNIDIGVKGPFIIRGVIISLITSIISLMVPLLPRLSHQLSLSICSYIYSRIFHLQLTNSPPVPLQQQQSLTVVLIIIKTSWTLSVFSFHFLYFTAGDSLAVPQVQYPAPATLQPRPATTGNVDLLMPLQPKLLAILGN